MYGAPLENTASKFKDAVARRAGKKQAGHLKHMNGMEEALNKEIFDNCFPHWRDHPSLKGK